MKVAIIVISFGFVFLAATRADNDVSYSKQIWPILEEHCLECHDAENQQNSFSMASFRDLFRGGKSGRALTPGDPDESLLVKKITGEDKPRMPKKRPPLSKEQIDLIKKWIEQGPRNN